MQQMIFIAVLIACSTCFEHHYVHHRELEGIIQVVAACLIWCHTTPTTWKPKHQIRQAATNCIILSSSWWWT